MTAEVATDRSACTKDWVFHPPTVKGWVYAVGSAGISYEPLAKATRRAQENARAELSKELSVVVSAVTEIDSERHRTQEGATFASHLRESISSSAPEIELPGVEIVESCMDPTQQTVYALARLNKQKAARGLERQLAQLGAEFGRDLSVPSTIPRTEQLRRLLPTLETINKYDKLEETLKRISGYPPPSSSTKTALEYRINYLLDRLTIVLFPRGQDAKAIRPYLAQYLAGEGLRIRPNAPGDLVLDYQLKTRSVAYRGLYFVYASGEVAIKDSRGRTINTFMAEAKGGSPTSNARAREQAIKDIGQQLGESLAKSLVTSL